MRSFDTGAASRCLPVMPGQMLGVLGGGQLGRMFAVAARQMGYRVMCLDPTSDCPTGQVADVEVLAGYDDIVAAESLARRCAAVTVEFENIPTATLEAVARHTPVRPSAQVLHLAQHRLREKEWLASIGVPTAPFAAVGGESTPARSPIEAALETVGLPAILKTASFGYDGKGQHRLGTIAEVRQLDHLFTRRGLGTTAGREGATAVATHVLEGFVPFVREISVVLARGVDGQSRALPVFENVHVSGILDCTVCPAQVSASVHERALSMALEIAERLNLVGVLCVEMFVTADERVLVNELAPRPHNSGHLSIDVCTLSQFDLQVRCTAGLPLGEVSLLVPAACMVNLLGECWLPHGPGAATVEPAWDAALSDPHVALHLYGKDEPRVGRKMGHLVAWGETIEQARQRAVTARSALRRQ